VSALTRSDQDFLLLINGVHATDWREEREFLRRLAARAIAVAIVDPRGVGTLQDPRVIRGHEYGDPLTGVEENLAYNAFLVGRSLLGMRVADVVLAASQLTARVVPRRTILCGRRDAGLVALFAAAVEPRIAGAAVEETRLTYLPLFEVQGQPINASELAPGLLRDFGDIPEILAQISPRQILAAACPGPLTGGPDSVRSIDQRFSMNAELLLTWLA
jgi:hypothetical protein